MVSLSVSQLLPTRMPRAWRRVALLTRPSAQMTPDRWAALNRTYPQSTPIPGPRDPYLTPYIIAPELAVAECAAKRVVLVTASQSGKTEMLLDIAGSRLDQKPAPIL